MQRRHAALGLLVIALSTEAFFALAYPQTQNPADVVGRIVAASQKQNEQEFLSNLTSESRNALLMSTENYAALTRLQGEFMKALDARFGAGNEMRIAPPVDIRTAMSRLTNAEVVSQSKKPDGSVELHVKSTFRPADGKSITREDTLRTLQQGGRWKLALGIMVDEKAAADRRAAAQQVVLSVKNGKFKDRLEAMIALANAWGGGRKK